MKRLEGAGPREPARCGIISGVIMPGSPDAASHRAELTAKEYERFPLGDVHGNYLTDKR